MGKFQIYKVMAAPFYEGGDQQNSLPKVGDFLNIVAHASLFTYYQVSTFASKPPIFTMLIPDSGSIEDKI